MSSANTISVVEIQRSEDQPPVELVAQRWSLSNFDFASSAFSVFDSEFQPGDDEFHVDGRVTTTPDLKVHDEQIGAVTGAPAQSDRNTHRHRPDIDRSSPVHRAFQTPAPGRGRLLPAAVITFADGCSSPFAEVAPE